MRYFINLENKSLEQVELFIDNVETPTIVPALSEYHVEKRQFMRYSKPQIYHQDGTEIIGAKDMWIEMVDFILQDYEWLLQLPFYKFWSNIVFCYPYIDSLKAVLEESPRFHELKDFPNDEKMKKMLCTLHKKVINIFFRIVTNKQNASEFISNEYHAHLIYENFLITVPVMMQLSQLFGRENETIIHKIIYGAVKHQSCYKNDFKELVRFSCQILGEMEERLLNSENTNAAEKGILRILNLDKKLSSGDLNSDEVEDMVIYLMDFTSSLEIFITVYPPVIEYFSSDFFFMKIISIYENELPELYRRLKKNSDRKKNQKRYLEMNDFLDVTRLEIIRIFRAIAFRGIMSILQQPDITEATNIKESVDQFLNYLTSAMSDKHLMLDYNQVYPISDDLELIHQITTDIDQIKVSFLRRLISDSLVDNSPKASNNVAHNSKDILQPVAGPSGIPSSTNRLPATDLTNISEVGLRSLIYNVKDIVNELGEGFIQICLQHYNYNTETVLNAILEDSLPPEIKNLDRQLPYIPPESEKIPAFLRKEMEDLNISDNDLTTEEVTRKSNDGDNNVEIFRGKRKSKYRSLNDMLNDKSFKNKVIESYSKYDLVEDYDDDYDDSLNDNPIFLNDDSDTDKIFTTPRILQTNRAVKDDEESESEPSTSNGLNNRNNFVEDPAVLRAQAEQRRQRNNPNGQKNDQNRKKTNKSSRSHHNARSQAAWKRRPF